MKYYNITEGKARYVVTNSGIHVFWCENISGEIMLNIKNTRARVYFFGHYALSGSKRASLKITQHHSVSGAQSHVLIKSVLRGHAHFTCTGTINIDKNASNTVATFQNRNLLMSADASVKTQPQLEVFPSDVSCSHAATSATIDQDQLHYLMSRGLTRTQSDTIIATGFLEDLIAKRDDLTKK